MCNRSTALTEHISEMTKISIVLRIGKHVQIRQFMKYSCSIVGDIHFPDISNTYLHGKNSSAYARRAVLLFSPAGKNSGRGASGLSFSRRPRVTERSGHEFSQNR